MGLFDMAKKLIGTIPVIGPIIEKGSSFIDMLPKDDDKKTGAFGGLYPQGYQAFEQPNAPRIPLGVGRSARLGVRPPDRGINEWRRYMERFESAGRINSIVAGKVGNVVAGRVGSRVGSVRGGTPARPATSRTLKA